MAGRHVLTKAKGGSGPVVNLSQPSYCLGIDPGLKGALALLALSDRRNGSGTKGRGFRRIVEIFDVPVTDGRVDPAKLAMIVGLCQLRGSIRAVVELVSSMPRQSGAFNFGVSTGVVHGVLGALGVPFSLVPPAVWKPAMGLRRGLNESQAENKSRARELAAKLWPEQAGLFKRVKDDGRAESALLSFFYAQKMGWI